MYGGNSSQYSSGSYGTPPPQQYQQQQQQQQQQSGQPQWVKASNGQIPPGAIIGGLDKNGEPLFIARAYYNNGIHPGEAGRQIEGGGFSFSYDSDQIFLSQYEVLCGNGKLLTWVDQEGIPNFETFRPFRAGREESGEEASFTFMYSLSIEP
ncbi:hypothetical protein H4219_002394 [Mycoemilia scoparia]|uniref:Uncharacterized protein n=1 Tax=Mycoemilia scoparia TaxID=417184 RepID=A0A9W8A1A5_9FUNG|nr:hypothetical protein H4219_002394 [Mycoemilia scoparia]